MKIRIRKVVTTGVSGIDVRYAIFLDGLAFTECDEKQFNKFKEVMGIEQWESLRLH